MKTLSGMLVLSAFACVAVPSGACADDVRAGFRDPPPGYGEVPFWWWTGEKLSKDRLLWQIEELHRAGVSGMQVNYSHQRLGTWNTTPTDPEIFSDEWWDFFSFAAVECAKRGMGIGLSGYTLDWPGNDNLYRRLGITADELRGRVLVPVKDASAPYGIRVEPRVKDRTLDPLNPESARRVIERFFEPFLARVPKEAHKALNYFFQDELRLAGDRYVWCDDFPDEFMRRKGYDVRPCLVALFTDIGADTERIRLDYNDVMVQLESERYFRPIFDWHASRGMIWACDPASRGHDPLEFGDYMRAMRWYTAPGFDTPGTSADVLKNKVGSSIAHLYGRPRVWLEGYHSQGWQASAATIFDSTVHNFAYGANLFNLHGLYYTTYGGWWEWAPPCYHFRQPYWVHMPAVFKYFERLAYVLTRGEHACDVAIVYPVEPHVVDRGSAGKKASKRVREVLDELVKRRSVDCDFLDGDSLARASVENGRLRVAGERYRTLILPEMRAIRERSLAKARAFAAAGGTVISLGEGPEIAGAKRTLEAAFVGVPDFSGPVGVKVNHRRAEAFDFYFLVDLDETAECSFRATGRAELWDPETGTSRPLPGAASSANGTVRVRVPGVKGVPRLVVFARDGKRDPGAVARRELADWRATRDGRTARRQIPLDGDWTMSVKPTMDNRWGDFRLPAAREVIGPEVAFMDWVDAPEGTREIALGYGPQFVTGETPSDGIAPRGIFEFSWRYGAKGRPGFQNSHHGLHGNVGDEFLILGPYPMRDGWMPNYDVVPPKDADGLATHWKTSVYAPEACRVVVEVRAKACAGHAVAKVPVLTALRVDGRVVKPGEAIALSAGYAKLEASFRGVGRASVVCRRTDLPSSEPFSPPPLAMRWYGDPAVLKFDPYGGAVARGRFTVAVPPCCTGVTARVRGTLLKNEIADGKLTLEVAFAPGCVGGNAFEEPLKLLCRPARAPLGDWARWRGFASYSGGMTYEKGFRLDAADAARGATLDLGAVGASADVRVNGGSARVLFHPPWTLEIPAEDLRAGENLLTVTVYNTLNNHYLTIPTRYGKAVETVPSGLLGPVALTIR